MSEHDRGAGLVEAIVVASELIDKVRRFADQLDPQERQMLAALLSPGIAAAYPDDDEVSLYSADWSITRLPEHLRIAIQDRSLRVEGW